MHRGAVVVATTGTNTSTLVPDKDPKTIEMLVVRPDAFLFLGEARGHGREHIEANMAGCPPSRGTRVRTPAASWKAGIDLEVRLRLS